MEDEGVCDNGARHAARLWNVHHPEQARYLHRYAGLGPVQFIQDGGNALDTSFESVRGVVDGLLRHRHQPDQVGKVADRTAQPARFGETTLGLFGVEDAVRKAGVG